MLYTCERHDNCIVVYDTYNCPVCELENELEEFKVDLDNQRIEIENLEFIIKESGK